MYDESTPYGFTDRINVQARSLKKITLYSDTGIKINEWTGNYRTQYIDNAFKSIRLVDSNGKEIIINGGILTIEYI